jgi:type IV pilus assembly protein PilO
MAMTLDDIKKMSPRMKALAIGVIYLIFGYFYFFYFLQAGIEKRGNLQTKLQELEQQVATKEKLAAELDKYIKGIATLKEEFQTALTKLPIRKEIPELLQNVALSGKNAGLSFLLFEPQPSVKKPIGGPKAADQKTPDKKTPPEQKPPAPKPADGKTPPKPPLEEGDYYEEIPVKVTVNGGYNSTAAFFAKVAGLPRIINIEDVSMGDAKTVQGRGLLLTTSCIVKTYMFVQKSMDKKPGEQKAGEQQQMEKDKKADAKK